MSDGEIIGSVFGIWIAGMIGGWSFFYVRREWRAAIGKPLKDNDTWTPGEPPAVLMPFLWPAAIPIFFLVIIPAKHFVRFLAAATKSAAKRHVDRVNRIAQAEQEAKRIADEKRYAVEDGPHR